MSNDDSDKDLVLDIPSNFREEDELTQLENSDDVDKLRAVLDEDEKVFRLLVCYHDESDGVLAATNKRIIFADKRFVTSKVVTFKYREVAALIYNTELVMQTITLAHFDGSFTVNKVQKDHGDRFIEYVGNVISQDYTTEGKNDRVLRHNNDLLRLKDLPSQDS